jgi:ATP-dependent DNA ligase
LSLKNEPSPLAELRRIFDLEKDWTVLDAEWLKPEGLLFVFDILKLNGKSLRSMTYQERYDLLPRSFISPVIKTLPILTTLNKCLEVLASKEKYVEGLVFKAPYSKGFEDTSIVRCRRR